MGVHSGCQWLNQPLLRFTMRIVLFFVLWLTFGLGSPAIAHPLVWFDLLSACIAYDCDRFRWRRPVGRPANRPFQGRCVGSLTVNIDRIATAAGGTPPVSATATRAEVLQIHYWRSACFDKEFEK